MLQFSHDNETYKLPTQLSEITLGQLIEWEEIYGLEISKGYEGLIGDEDLKDDEKEMELATLKMDTACKAIAFFAGIPLEVVQSEFAVTDVLNLYDTHIFGLIQKADTKEEEAEPKTFIWNDEPWEIQAPILNSTSGTVFNEFLTSKEIVRQLGEYGAGQYEALIYLCAIYLRKPGEPFNETDAIDGSEKMRLMRSLPADIAVEVGFFLTDSMNSYSNTLVALRRGAEERMPSTLLSTSEGTDG